MKLIDVIFEVDSNSGNSNYKLDQLSFDIVKSVFPNIDSSSYGSSIAFPQPSDGMRMVHNSEDLESWKSETKERYGDVTVAFYPNASAWYDKVKVLDDKFIKDKDNYTNAKASWLDSERDAGRSYGLD
jgi:hypothetical protein